MKTRIVYIKRLALVIVFSALGVAISPFLWFPFLGTQAYPTQHMINAILGVLVGPFWAAIAAIFIGSIRIMLGVGSPYAFPGGIPGGIVVGIVYWLLKRLKISERKRLISALSEPIGTLLIGVPLSLLLFAPLLATQELFAPWKGKTQDLLNLTADKGAFAAFLILGTGWAFSCVPGSIIGFVILLVLNKAGINQETLFGEK
jgi:energy coupling factor transporter S component ThiW